MERTTVTGSILSGTMLVEDRINAFDSFLERHAPKRHALMRASCAGWFASEDDDKYDEEESFYVLEALINAMNDIAPKGYYFGAHVGDGADYGFWPASDHPG